MKKKFYITYEAETPAERNFEIKMKKWGNIGYYAKTSVYEVVRPKQKFFRCKYLGDYTFEVENYETLEEVAQMAVIRAMSEEEYQEKIKNMWKGA
jgi:hypothetical protein